MMTGMFGAALFKSRTACSAARDLALRGYPVTLFEAHDKLGGTIVVYSWPEGRLRGTFLITYLERFSGRHLGT